MSIEDYRSYVRAHPRFLLFGDTGAWVWLLPDLMATGARLQLVAMDGSLRLFLVDTAVESGDRTGGLGERPVRDHRVEAVPRQGHPWPPRRRSPGGAVWTPIRVRPAFMAWPHPRWQEDEE